MKITVENVLPKLLEWLYSGQRVCLATLYHSHGASPRPVGSQMAIAEDGQWFGYLSGGCAEQAIAEEGVDVITQASNRSVRYGIGSAYLDIQLPCGAGIDVWFDQTIRESHIEVILDRLGARKLSALQCDAGEAVTPPRIVDFASPLQQKEVLPDSEFRRWYVPPRRLYIIGAGPAAVALAALALSLIHISEPTRQEAISYAVFCLKKNIKHHPTPHRRIASLRVASGGSTHGSSIALHRRGTHTAGGS